MLCDKQLKYYCLLQSNFGSPLSQEGDCPCLSALGQQASAYSDNDTLCMYQRLMRCQLCLCEFEFVDFDMFENKEDEQV